MILYSSISRSGDREVNEDTVGSIVMNGKPLFVIADGLGGHGYGDQASQFVVEQFMSTYPYNSDMEPAEYIQTVLRSTQDDLLRLQKQNHRTFGMKSTAVVVIYTGNSITVGHIGDSRAYLFGRFGVLWRTLDHSVPQMLAQAGEIKEREIRHHPDRNKLLHALGDETDNLKIDIMQYPKLSAVRGILLCSDGFWEYVEERQMIFELYRSKMPEEWLERMEKIVLKNGKGHRMDNYSAVAAMVK